MKVVFNFQDMQAFNIWWGSKHPDLNFGQAIELWKKERKEDETES